jgi:hypothetical protein
MVCILVVDVFSVKLKSIKFRSSRLRKQVVHAWDKPRLHTSGAILPLYWYISNGNNYRHEATLYYCAGQDLSQVDLICNNG